ncbi:hypothetical protein LCGC14_2083560 [marine sediment metagenome]|uniref:Baseplate protein J-like domain-containing protein n=1 Tax=marine sediment metagenome TaxID=412755 RepID=A0A0F9EER0_9ZZZZ
MDYQVTTQPSHEPVTLLEAKLYLRVTHSSEDAVIENLIRMARQEGETYHNHWWLRRTVTAKIDRFPAKEIRLPGPRLIGIDSITYVDVAGVTQTLATSVYDVDTSSEPGKITLAYNQTWPTIRGDHHGITIVYKAGYVATCTAADATDLVTVAAGVYAVGDRVRFYTTDTLPAGLSVDTDYYVITVAGNDIQVSATLGGTTVDITDTGTGTHTIDAVPVGYRMAVLSKALEKYVHRGDDHAPTNQMFRDLLGPDRMVGVQ